jgi:hypothetical protein
LAAGHLAAGRRAAERLGNLALKAIIAERPFAMVAPRNASTKPASSGA